MNCIKAIDKNIFYIIRTYVNKINKKSYVIGGYVRDFFKKKKKIKKINIITVVNCIKLAKKVCKKLYPKYNIYIFKNLGIAMYKNTNLNIEFVCVNKLKFVQKKSNFTINTLAISLNNLDYGKLIDPFGGLFDINKKKIRSTLDREITDIIRIIRAIRFYIKLNFKIYNNKKIIKIFYKKRIIYEFHKILLYKKPSIGIFYLYKIGLLSIILPELINIKGIEIKNNFKHKDNFFHTLEVVDNISIYTNNIWLKWAALLHDIGKYITKKYKKNFGWTFYSHELIGSKMITSIFERLKLPKKKNIKYVKNIIKYSSRPLTLISYTATDSSIRRLLFDIGDDIEDLILLCKSDITTKNFIKKKQYKKNLFFLKKKIKKIKKKDKIRNWIYPISGYHIMNIFGINSCKEIGILKKKLKNAIIKGIIQNNFEKANLFIIETGKNICLI
ncbi:HD domain-containing protein [Candidatus Karelsulcia muelleri]|uniref:tRNA nucleotidyltransferase n=1 Tax=Candidatus Karelsulcia muelleri PSPU TaxID=1189303 RepID=A0AAD1B2I7_9FLAO|nr:HD domain-containing protein [Candidatus Karelsulcia muelleri]NJJ98621.1 HD domain-containing protein [Candidatus Karelsulcia muelleri]BAO66278.1 tRNA nucleotidyltransferase [Candidatus Karelsulcia muelleri PSPU]